MLTPAEELGLSGHSLDGHLRKLFYALPDETIVKLTEQVRQAAFDRHLLYLHDGRPDAIHVFLRPLAIMPDQLAYLHYVSLTIINALKRAPELYMQDFAVRDLFPLSEGERQWLWDAWGPAQRENNPVLGRLDAVVELTSPMWKDSLKFLEPNLSGVGGIHLGPTCDEIIAEVVLPTLRASDGALSLELGRDLRELFIQEVLDHLDSLGRRGRNLCFIEPKYAGEGPDEQEALCEYYRRQHGMRITHADPAELELRGGEVYYDNQVVDIGYRDYEVRDLLELGKRGVDLAPIRTLFRENRIISSMVGEFDHKSCWELLTDPQFTQKYFTAEERQVFRRHILWTRILADRQTSLPDGTIDDLLPFVREEREILVIKPNRAYGGEGVLIGHSTPDEEWQAAVDSAVASPETWVVQRQAILPVCEFPVVDADQRVHSEPFHVVLGFAATKYGLSIVARASQKQVVNVAQRGGMCAILVGRPPGRLVGPAKL